MTRPASLRSKDWRVSARDLLLVICRRINMLRKTQLPSDWDGSYSMTEK